METRWVDYYNVLQVNQQAKREVIESRYKALCKVCHPDVNSAPDAEEQMKLINLAWEVLRDDEKRTEFHREWERRNLLRFAGPSPRGSVAAPEDLAARRVVSRYFRGIMQGRYDEVYGLLSSRDRRNIPAESFIKWQCSVAVSYRIRQFLVLSGKKYDSFPMGETNCPAERFSIEITERDLRTGSVARYKLIKFTVREGNDWRVYLGYRDIDYIVEQFSLLSGVTGEAYSRSVDSLTGLPSRRGFLDKCRPEIYRSARYGRKCTLGIVTAHFGRNVVEPELRRHIVQQTGFSLRASVRLIDIVGALENDRFCVLMAETGIDEAYRASARLATRVEQDILACFDTQIKLTWRLTLYDGGDLAHVLEQAESMR